MAKTSRLRAAGLISRDHDLGLLLVLQLLSELSLTLDPLDDGSGVCGRALGVLGAWAALGCGPGRQLRRLRRLISANEPLIARIARPLTPQH